MQNWRGLSRDLACRCEGTTGVQDSRYGKALITTGFISLDAQAKVLGLPRSTAWRILSAEHKGTGISARIICRMLSSEPLPPLVRAKIIEYANEKAAGIYGGSETKHRKFTSKLALYGLGEWPIRLRDVS
jgi:hypothetical protein